MSLWLGIDLGTTGVRCVAFDDAMRVVSSAYEECPPDYLPGGVVEQDADDWVTSTWRVIVQCCADLEQADLDRADVRGLAISSQGITMVPVDSNYVPIRAAVSWLDGRGAAWLERLLSVAPEEWRRRTGKTFSDDWSLATLAWLAAETDDVAHYVMPHDFVLQRLTGVCVTDRSLASGTMAYDLGYGNDEPGSWAQDLLAVAGVRVDQLPRIAEAGTVVGPLLPHVAAELGLPNVTVVVGGQDQKCAAFAAGMPSAANDSEDVATVSLGTAAAVEAVASPEPADDDRVNTFAYVGGGEVREGAVATAGAAVRWAAGILTSGDVARLADLAATSTADMPLFFPHLSQTASSRHRWAAAPAGTWWGMTLDSTPADLARAVFVGVTCEVVLLLKALGDGVMPWGALRLFGGGASSPMWCQLFADITGHPVEVLSTHEAAAAGAAMLARQGVTGEASSPLPIAATYRTSIQRSVDTSSYTRVRADLYRGEHPHPDGSGVAAAGEQAGTTHPAPAVNAPEATEQAPHAIEPVQE